MTAQGLQGSPGEELTKRTTASIEGGENSHHTGSAAEPSEVAESHARHARGSGDAPHRTL